MRPAATSISRVRSAASAAPRSGPRLFWPPSPRVEQTTTVRIPRPKRSADRAEMASRRYFAAGSLPQRLARLTREVERLTLHSEHLDLAVTPLVKPVWANAIGCDARGLYVELFWRGQRCRLDWRPPEGGGDSPDAEGEVDLPVNWPGFGQMVSYWEVFDPYEEDEPVGGSLTDDLLDIYRDLGRGLLAWNSGARESALWDWKFHFELHWGDHAVDALRALKRACYRLGT